MGPVTTRDGTGVNSWALCGMALSILALWLLLHPFGGVVHDSLLYTLLALARLHPALQHDFAVRFGTQDQYTIFSPVYAAAIHWLGVGHAAALLTLLSQAGFFFAAWLIARTLLPAHTALLGIGLLVVLPSWYGAEHAFSYIEPFLTPRQPAAALVLAGVFLTLIRKSFVAAICMAGAALLHPIIAGAGILFWISFEFGTVRPRLCLLAALILIVLCAALALVPGGLLPRFDADWLSALQARLTFMFPSHWSMRDWAQSVPGLATLAIGAGTGANPLLRRLCNSALLTAVGGLALVLVGGDLLHLELGVQLQSWRWLWLTGALSLLLLPLIVGDAWHHGASSRGAVLALLACWIVVDFPTLPVSTVPPGSHLAARLMQLRDLASIPLCGAGLLLLLWLAAYRGGRRSGVLLLTMGFIVLLPTAVYAARSWTRALYPDEFVAAFEPWRRAIPQDAQVLWPDSPPRVPWYVLQRANYWSLEQMSGSVFSRQEWQTGTRRQAAIVPLLPLLGGTYVGITGPGRAPAPTAALGTLCSIPDLDFVASWRDLGPTPYPVLDLPRPDSGGRQSLRLYSCGHGH